MRYNNVLKDLPPDSDFFKSKLYHKSNTWRSFKKTPESDAASCESIASNSTTYTLNSRLKRDAKDFKGSKRLSSKRGSVNYKDKGNTILDIIYDVINDLYDEEILPTIHEIRRKLNKYDNVSLDAQSLLNLCSGDVRLMIMCLEPLTKHSNDIQNQWAILIKDNPFNNFDKSVDDDLLHLVSNYLILISSYRYRKLGSSDTRGHVGAGKVASQLNDNCDSHVCKKDVVIRPIDDILKVGGRYLFAEHLKKNGPKKVSSLPLGKILNIVQKLTDLGLLVYKGNFLVTVVNSKSASNKFILNINKSFNQHCLSEVKNNFTRLFNGGNKIPLSSLPIVYRNTFGEDVNYLDMGYEKLSEFIKNEVPWCKIIKKWNQHVVYMPIGGPEGNGYEDNLRDNSSDSKPKSQVKLNVPYTTLLYPFKITPIGSL